MAKTSKNIIDDARKDIPQLDIDAARKLMEQPGTVVIDVRESDEWRQGHLPNAVAIPRGFLELRIEEKVPDHKTPVILQCASGTRSLLAARTLKELGYEKVYNLVGGFNSWKDRGLPWVADRQFTQDEITRYSRHFVIPEVGEKGQAKLLDSKVLLLGAGALGSSSALYLAAAGVGTIGLVDFDTVDLSNLQRQIIHTTDRVGMMKTESAQKAINALNPAIKVNRHEVRLSSENVMDIIKDYDVVINCGDNFPTRYLINDACVFAKKPLVDGAIFRFEGNATVYYPDKGGPCYRCLYPEPAPPDMAPSCAEAGVLGALPGLIGSIEALEAIKLLLGAGEPLIGRMVYFDTLSGRDYVRIFKVKKDPKCPVCSEHPTQTTLIDYEAFCGLAPASIDGDATQHAAGANGHASAQPAGR
jgi:molybdopterin/thiamine biosynthesis adenylyltransferase/rhodanese-related sulfurtransferase